MLLPRPLLALALLAALPLSASSDPVSTYDPFRSIVLKHRALHPGPPLCCLKTPPSASLPEGPEDTLLSFEEWKSKQLRAHSQTAAPPRPETPSTDSEDPTSGRRQTWDPYYAAGGANSNTPLADYAADSAYPRDSIPPHFRVPLTDRFNYANMDCSARVHMAHRSAKSASSILSSKKDRYMLSPCTGAAGAGTQKSAGGGVGVGEAQFVVVELCDDIRIDTVQMANFEFFSGVFKDFSVRVAKTYPATEDGWTVTGTYRAKNVRGVQVRFSPICHFWWCVYALLTARCSLGVYVVIPSAYVSARFLQVHSHRFSFALWTRVLLPGVAPSGVWSHASRAVEVGYVGGGEPCSAAGTEATDCGGGPRVCIER